MRSAILRAAVFVVIVAAAMWRCGGGNPYGGGSSGTPSAPTATGANTINIMGQRGAQSFSPNPAAISQGDPVAWHNTDNTTHRIVLNDGSLDTGDIAPGATSTGMRLATNGANYHCTFHPTMVGSINSSTGAPPPCTGAYCP
jgi:plastocyanin